jgi:2-(1,2-epoxy-1,2-dihydrophenyl)acetyl-CoA isomerase
MQPAVRLSIEEGIARIVFDRPEQGNKIGDDFITAFDAATLKCSERDDIRAVVISSTGDRFSVGGDISAMVEQRDELPTRIRRWNASLQGSLARLQRMPAPSVVAVQGVAAGGSVSLVASCDVIVAADSARFVAAYASIGYCMDMGGSTALTRRLGLARTRRFYLLHEQLDAKAAEQAGLVDLVVSASELTATVEKIARRWAAGPTAAYGEIRRLLQSASETPYETQMELETQSLARLARTDDAWDGLNAFLQKRSPRFTGR